MLVDLLTIWSPRSRRRLAADLGLWLFWFGGRLKAAGMVLIYGVDGDVRRKRGGVK